MIRLIGALLAVLLAGGTAQALMPSGAGTTYYVGTTGCNDSGAGTSQGVPWCTITKVNSFTFNCGDTVLFLGGASFSTTVALNASSTIATPAGKFAAACSPSTPFTLASYGTGKATISTSSTTIDGLDVSDMGGVIIHDLILSGPASSTATGSSGIAVFNDQAAGSIFNFVYMYNIEASSWDFGIQLKTNHTGAGFNNVSILNSKTHDNVSGGVIALGPTNFPGKSYSFSNVFVKGVESYNNKGVAGASVSLGNGISLGVVLGGVITNSVAHNNGLSATSTSTPGPVGISAHQSSNIIISFSESYDNHVQAAASDGDGFDLGLGMFDSVIEWCYAHGNSGHGFQFDQLAVPWYSNNVAIRYNISENNNFNSNTDFKAGEILAYSAGGTVGSAYVYGNTFYSSIAGSLFNFLGGDNYVNSVAANNILLSANASTKLIDTSTTGSGTPSGWKFQGNDYSGTSSNITWGTTSYTSVALWVAGNPAQETYRGVSTALTASPSLASPGTGGTCFTSGVPGNPQPCPSSYTLQAGSAMLNAGQKLPAVFGIQPGGTDYYVNIVPAPSNGNYDVGADQRTQ